MFKFGYITEYLTNRVKYNQMKTKKKIVDTVAMQK